MPLFIQLLCFSARHTTAIHFGNEFYKFRRASKIFKGRNKMKKFLALSLLLLSVVAFVPSAEAKTTNGVLTANTSAAPQIRVQVGQNRRYNNRRYNNRRTVRTYTRNVRVGRRIYRETYRVVYRANGTTRTRLLSRVRIGRY